MELANFNNFNSVATAFKENKSKSKKLEIEVNNYIEENTQLEKQQLEQAVKNYNEKVRSVMTNKKTQIDQIENYHSQMNDTLTQTYEAFNQATIQILQNDSLSNEQKERKIQQISEYIMQNLYTQEEIDRFKIFAEQFEILLPGKNFSKRVKNIKNSNSNPNSNLRIKYS